MPSQMPSSRAMRNRLITADALSGASVSALAWAFDVPLGEGELPSGPADTHLVHQPVLALPQGSGHKPLRGVLNLALRLAVRGGFCAVLPMASPASSLSRSALSPVASLGVV